MTTPTTDQIRINVRSIANVADVRKETRDGREVLIVPSATLPDDIVMNGRKYPADEIAKTFMQLEGTPAPYGHPMVGGKHVSAKVPAAINVNHIGAHNENVRRVPGADGRNRVFMDKIIDVVVANRSEEGKAVLAAIEARKPIHTSTGLFCQVDVVNAADHSMVARDLVWDHDAILLNEEGAATPEQGVGMLVNGQEITVINSSAEDAMAELDWAVERVARAAKRVNEQPFLDRLKATLLEAFAPERVPTANTKETTMADDKKLEELSAKVAGMEATLGSIGETITNAVTAAVKPLQDAQEAIVNAQKAKDDAELATLRAAIVNANLMDEDAAQELTINAARALAPKTKPGTAAPVNGSFVPNSAADTGFKLPKGEDA